MSHVPTILLAEDDPDDALFARMALKKSGWPHHLDVVSDGEQAVNYLFGAETRERLPAFVLLDLKLPKLDGKRVLRELRGNPRTARVPVIVLSSSQLEQDVLDCYSLGAHSYIRKPIDLGEFNRGVSALAAYWLGLNVPPRLQDDDASGPGRAGFDRLLELGHPDEGTQREHAERVLALRAGATPPEVMVVDDHPDDRQATCDALRGVVGAEPVATLHSFEECVALLRLAGGPPPEQARGLPRIMILDPDMLGGRGLDVVQALRYRMDHHMILVVFTRDRRPGFASDCYRLKANGVVLKPDDPEAYRDAVQLVGQYWVRINQRPPPAWTTTAAVGHPG